MNSEDLRRQMVAEQIRKASERRSAVSDPAVLTALEKVPRELFVPGRLREKAFTDQALPIGLEQTISQPYIVALMTQLLELRSGDRVLEIGTGSGYQAAILAEITPHVYSVEIRRLLLDRAKATLDAAGYGRIHLRFGDGAQGWPEEAPFDAIIVTAGVPQMPPALWEQLRTGGRLVIPVAKAGTRHEELLQMRKKEDGTAEVRSIIAVNFVPFIQD